MIVIRELREVYRQLLRSFEKILFTLICPGFNGQISKLILHDHWLERMYPMIVTHQMAILNIFRSLDILANLSNEVRLLYR